MKKVILYILFTICHFVNGQSVDSSLIEKVKEAKPFIRYGKKSNSLTISIEKLFVKDEVFWFGFVIGNHSGLSYPVDLLRIFIRDITKTNRSSVQELEITPLYLDTVHLVASMFDRKFLIAVPKFTIPDNKVCVLELFETNGGRNVFLEINNRLLFLARPFSKKDASSNKKQVDRKESKKNARKRIYQYEKQNQLYQQNGLLPVTDSTRKSIRKIPGHQQLPEY